MPFPVIDHKERVAGCISHQFNKLFLDLIFFINGYFIDFQIGVGVSPITEPSLAESAPDAGRDREQEELLALGTSSLDMNDAVSITVLDVY